MRYPLPRLFTRIGVSKSGGVYRAAAHSQVSSQRLLATAHGSGSMLHAAGGHDNDVACPLWLTRTKQLGVAASGQPQVAA